jgi:transposase-like protein
MVSALVRTVFAQQVRGDAHAQRREVADKLRDNFHDVAALMDEAEHDVWAYMAFDRDLHTKIHPTNPLERLNKEIKRRTNVVGIFPNRAAVIRLVGALMLEQNDVWGVSRRYVSMESLKEICDEDDGEAMIPAE